MLTLVKQKKLSGFSLIEMAIVLVIIGFTIGALIVPLGAQREVIKIKQAREELKVIEQAIMGFAIANGRIPCPAIPGTGVEDPVGGGVCTNARGFIPVVTLGISGHFNCENLLLDPWGNPYRYSVTIANGSSFTTNVTVVPPPLNAINVCDGSPCPPATELTTEAVAVVYSMGKNWATMASADEIENGEGTIAGTGCGPANYNISNDDIYVHRESVEIAGSEYDDIVLWISPNILYAKLLEAGVL
ncbi:MAG: type II secretion system GspH family protein [Gammaproteobacteria bacterium]|nr:type II secretion system GspH family protein [Gammaproteobacteria bacterium]